MKTAVSIPDDIFLEAEKAAEEMGISRSELYRQALKKLLKERHGEHISAELNAFYAEEDNRDPGFEKMQLLSLKREEW